MKLSTNFHLHVSEVVSAASLTITVNILPKEHPHVMILKLESWPSYLTHCVRFDRKLLIVEMIENLVNSNIMINSVKAFSDIDSNKVSHAMS